MLILWWTQKLSNVLNIRNEIWDDSLGIYNFEYVAISWMSFIWGIWCVCFFVFFKEGCVCVCVCVCVCGWVGGGGGGGVYSYGKVHCTKNEVFY